MATLVRRTRLELGSVVSNSLVPSACETDIAGVVGMYASIGNAK